MALQTALEFIENPNPKFIEAVEETARLAVSGTGWTLSLYPAAAVAAFLGIFTIAPLFSKITKICFVLKINMHYFTANISFTQVFNSFLARLARRSDYYYDYQIRNLQVKDKSYHSKFNLNVFRINWYSCTERVMY